MLNRIIENLKDVNVAEIVYNNVNFDSIEIIESDGIYERNDIIKGIVFEKHYVVTLQVSEKDLSLDFVNFAIIPAVKALSGRIDKYNESYGSDYMPKKPKFSKNIFPLSNIAIPNKKFTRTDSYKNINMSVFIYTELEIDDKIFLGIDILVGGK